MMISFSVVGNGYPAFSLLRTILASGNGRVADVVTLDPRHAPLVRLCEQHGIQTTSEMGDYMRADWLLNVNSTIKFSRAILNQFYRGALNLHPGPLPQYAGVHVEQWAIRNMESLFGATIHLMDEGIDTGPVVAQGRFNISENDTAL